MERFGTIRAYTSVFDARVQHYHYTHYLFLAGLILLGLMWYQVKRRRLDWALILTNLAFAVLYTRFLRTTYYWGWAWPKGRAVAFGMGGAIAVVCVALAVRAGSDAVCRPYGLRWFGFGIAYHNPVEEAEFIRTHLSGYRLGNDYSAGGYLLWALWPDMKVLIDPRQFPFKEWYGQYREFSTGRNVNDFVRSSACDVWSIRYEHTTVVSWFLGSPDWKVAFYGPSGVVFTRKDIRLPDGLPRAGQGTEEIKNINQAVFVFMFAVSMQDEHNARRILAGMREHFKCRDHRPRIQAASDWLDGTLAYFRRDYEKAVTHLEACRRNGIRSESLLVRCYDHLTVLAWSGQDDQRALSAAKAALAIKPGDRYAVFNSRIIESYLSERMRGGHPERPRLARPAKPAFSIGEKGSEGYSNP
ncbi:MAG: hypothetical protein JRF64_00655 [Deltaproteobacteria bacterium]|nr:hypothetical protein [Deltaproteobacteria bacterium]